jgi:hypothetical protein
LDQIRTNEDLLANQVGVWELRQFQLVEGDTGAPTLQEGTIAQTPDSENSSGDFNGAQNEANALVLTDYINEFQSQIISDSYAVPSTYDDPNTGLNWYFLGASVFNGGSPPQYPGYWNGAASAPLNSNIARSDFSLNTCNGCHARETANNGQFQQVINRATSGSPSTLSGFLLGCSSSSSSDPLTVACPQQDLYPLNSPLLEYVQDPVVSTQINVFGDLARRQQYMGSLLGGGCNSQQMLQSFVRHKTSFVH